MLPIVEYINHPRLFFSSLLKETGFLFSDKLYLQMMYYLKTGKRLDLTNPITFGEKLQWLKLYDRKPKYIGMVDKYAVKDYVARIIGEKYVIPTIGVWDKPEEIDFDTLPRQFVLKTTNGGGSSGVCICRDKSLISKHKIKEKLQTALEYDIYRTYREWPYGQVPRKIIAEQYIENRQGRSSEDLVDYKFYCFNGVPKYCQVIQNRSSRETIDFFDMDWRHQPFYGLNPEAKPANIPPAKPVHFVEMREIATKLSEGLVFSRIDLYDTIARPLFGEITLYPASGIGTFTPEEYNCLLGEMIKLPNR